MFRLKAGQHLFGVVDLKLTPENQVRILEFGGGGSGLSVNSAIDNIEQAKQCVPLQLASDLVWEMVAADKLFTHHLLTKTGKGSCLRPACGLYPRLGTSFAVELGDRVLTELKLTGMFSCWFTGSYSLLSYTYLQKLKPEQDACVLKLVNGIRGYGCYPSPASLVKERLSKLLEKSLVEEGCKHWLSNDCPCFLAEHLVYSKLVPGYGGHLYNGTMRVGFSVQLEWSSKYRAFSCSESRVSGRILEAATQTL